MSIDGQFPDIASFRSAVRDLMAMRHMARRFGRELFCHRNLFHARVTQEMTMQRAVPYFKPDEQRALMQWLTGSGPFWEDRRDHSSDDYLECEGKIVTDSAIGEVAFRGFRHVDSRLVSLLPSLWNFSPLVVWWQNGNGNGEQIEVHNYFDKHALEVALRAVPRPINSWEQLEIRSRERFVNLHFSSDAFEFLRGVPFNEGATKKITALFDTLHQMRCFVDPDGRRTSEGHDLYQKFFTGDKAWFSDSSDTEKNDFKSEMTFNHPEVTGETLFCTWHGKVRAPLLRIHFYWPTRVDGPFYIVYVGPKITKR
ncbi:MAG: hypothetical protein HQL83_09290 [Magnetococcales bacterium]|nr:hypothetical protein [Magnetococcales bacterium]